LNKHFASVFSIDNGTTPKVNDLQGPPIGAITFTKNGILKLLKDLIQPTPVAQMVCQPECSDALVLLFTASWKYKGGNKNRSKAENYRPVSLTSTTCKIMEHMLHSQIMQHFNQEHILSDTQHGFRKLRSYETQLIQTVHDLAKAINNQEQIDSVLLHFRKPLIRLVIGSCFTN